MATAVADVVRDAGAVRVACHDKVVGGAGDLGVVGAAETFVLAVSEVKGGDQSNRGRVVLFQDQLGDSCSGGNVEGGFAIVTDNDAKGAAIVRVDYTGCDVDAVFDGEATPGGYTTISTRGTCDSNVGGDNQVTVGWNSRVIAGVEVKAGIGWMGTFG